MTRKKALGGGLYELDGRIYIRQRGNGRDHLLGPFPNRRAARDLLAEISTRKQREAAGLETAKPNIRLDELIDLYLDAHPGDTRWLSYLLRHPRARFGPVRVRDLEPAVIAKWVHGELAGRDGKLLSPKTRRHVRSALSRVLGTGVEWGYLSRNPVRPRSVPPPAEVVPDVRPFSWAEVEQIALATGATWQSLVVLAASTGLRPSEWIALEWRDVDLANRTLTVNRTYRPRTGVKPTGKTTGALRTVVLGARAIEALELAQTRRGKSGLVIPSSIDTHLELHNWRRRVWKPTLTELGIEYRPIYHLRHTYACLLLEAGIELAWISEQMGHTNIQTTKKHYARFQTRSHERQRAILDTIGKEQG